jgi:hypothetical protein
MFWKATLEAVNGCEIEVDFEADCGEDAYDEANKFLDETFSVVKYIKCTGEE